MPPLPCRSRNDRRAASRELVARCSPSSACRSQIPCAGTVLHKQRVFRRAAVLALLLISFAACASARELKIEKFSAEVFVQPDSSLDVTETIEANFIGEWHGMYRTIPVEYVTPQGFNYSLFVKLIDATDAAGQPLKVESSRQGHYLKWKIYIDDATDVDRTITSALPGPQRPEIFRGS